MRCSIHPTCLIRLVGYRRTVLVIWPRWSDFAVLYAGRGGTLKAIKELNSFTAAHETARNFELVELILSRANQALVMVAQAVMHVAYQWNKPSLWVRAVKSCGIEAGLTALRNETEIFKAVESFGFDSIKEGCVNFEHKAFESAKMYASIRKDGCNARQ